jgi:hypothetical protein
VTAVAPLPGGITADMDRITVDSPTGLNDVVLRRWPGEDWTEGLVTREASALAARSLVGLRSTWPGCLIELPPRSAMPWTGSAN